MSNGSGFAALDEYIRKLRRIDGALEKAAPALAADMQTDIRADLAAGRAPGGASWASRKDDGGRAYAGAANALHVASSGDTIVATLEGPEVYGHRGVRGAAARPMLPTKLTPSIVARWRKRIFETFRKHLG